MKTRLDGPTSVHAESCQRCSRGNATWFAPSALWNAVMRDESGDDRYHFVCPLCFVDLAAEKGVDVIWQFAPTTDPDEAAFDAETAELADYLPLAVEYMDVKLPAAAPVAGGGPTMLAGAGGGLRFPDDPSRPVGVSDAT